MNVYLTFETALEILFDPKYPPADRERARRVAMLQALKFEPDVILQRLGSASPKFANRACVLILRACMRSIPTDELGQSELMKALLKGRRVEADDFRSANLQRRPASSIERSAMMRMRSVNTLWQLIMRKATQRQQNLNFFASDAANLLFLPQQQQRYDDAGRLSAQRKIQRIVIDMLRTLRLEQSR